MARSGAGPIPRDVRGPFLTPRVNATSRQVGLVERQPWVL
jgi:hypothetical protein